MTVIRIKEGENFMKKTLYTLFTAIAIACMAFGVMLMTNASVAKADVVPGTTPTFSSTKYLKSTDETMMIIATGINNYQDCYELGYEIEGAVAVTYDVTKYYTSISLNSGVWTVQELFDGYTAMIVWEVEYDKYYDVSFQAYAKVGNREGDDLVETDTVAYATEKTVASKVMLNTGFNISLPDYDENVAVTLEFDLYVTDARSPYTKVYWNLYDANNNYFGYYRVTYSGKQATDTSGYSIESIGTDTFHVTLFLKDLAGGSGTPGKLVRLADDGQSVNLDGAWIDNIQFCEPAGKVMLESGFDIRLPDYNPATAITLEFDVYVTEERSAYAKVYWNLCDADNNYFGYYRVTYAGKQATDTSGYSVTSISADNIIHVTLVLSELAGGSGTPGKLVKLKDNGQSVNLDGCWIDNIEFN